MAIAEKFGSELDMRDDSPAGDDQQVREDVKNLLRFTEQMLATREKTVFDIAEYPIRLTSQERQLKRSRTVCTTFHWRGITLSVSVISSPSLESLPPQQAQALGAGTTTRSRGKCAGRGARTGLRNAGDGRQRSSIKPSKANQAACGSPHLL